MSWDGVCSGDGNVRRNSKQSQDILQVKSVGICDRLDVGIKERISYQE